MGLFDRFRKKVKQAEGDSSIMAEEDSMEAKKALAERDEALRVLNRIEDIPVESVQTASEWDDFDAGISDPFSTPASPKDRKRAARDQASKTSEKIQNPSEKRHPMTSTTGRTLSESELSFEIDLSEYHTNIGGMVISGGPVLDEILEELEDELLSSDMGHAAASDLILSLRTHLIGSRVSRKEPLSEVVENALRGALLSLLRAGYWDFDRTIRDFIADETPVVIMMVGVNGTGKTTTSAKIAKRLDDQGLNVVLAAADTFRAGAIDQLAAHAERLGIRCIKSQRGGDSAAVARDAIESARARGDEIVIIDTSGRMQNKSNLMEELQKVRRIIDRLAPEAKVESLLILDASQGQNGLRQAMAFAKASGLTGVVITKLDGTSRGGVALAVASEVKLPIRFIGAGEGIRDLRPFNSFEFVEALLANH